MEINPNISLRQFTQDDWLVLKLIRLEALQINEHFFGRSYAEELMMTDDQWRSRLAGETSAMWGLYDSDTCIGLTGLFAIPDEPEAVMFIASYIRQAYRKMGLSKLYYEARLAWARDRGYKVARIGHRAGNVASMAANQKFGFQYTHTVNKTWHDGTQVDDLNYQLVL